MNHDLASAIGIAAVATLAATTIVFTPADALADDITAMDTTKFVSTASREDVVAAVKSQRALVSQAATEWALQQDPAPRLKSNYTRAEAMAAYIKARPEVAALTAEDSGANSPWVLKSRPADTAIMGGPQR